MPDFDRRNHWNVIYGSKRDDEVSWYELHPATSLALIAETGRTSSASVIDIGGGSSRLVDALLERGFQHITVLDIATTALDRAKARLGERAARVHWVAADITQWSPAAAYDVWHDRAVFHFLIDPVDRLAYRRALLAGLRLGGQLIIGTFALDGPERCSGLPIVRYDEEGLARELRDEFRLLDARAQDHVTPAGKQQRFQFARFERA